MAYILDRKLWAELSPSTWLGSSPPAHIRQLREDLSQSPKDVGWLTWALSLGAQFWLTAAVFLGTPV